MSEEIKSPKAFVSYSWTSDDHKDRVRQLADRLINDSVDILLDQYDLGEGDNTFAYMERMVTDTSVNKVIVVCDSGYKQKADDRKGGVGHESTIISPKVYEQISGSKASKNKFVAVIFEKDENGNAYIPAMFASTFYIDMSTEELYHANYERLARFLFDKPVLKKPEVGKPPSFILEDTRPSMPTTGKVASIKDAISRERVAFAKGALGDYFDVLVGVIEGMPPAIKEGNYYDDEVALREIQSFKSYRNEFAELIQLLCRFGNLTQLEFIEQTISFFERIGASRERVAKEKKSDEMSFDHIGFIVRELFLYSCSILIKNNKYLETVALLEQGYYVQNVWQGSSKYRNYEVFDTYLELLEKNSQQRLGTRYYSHQGHIMRETADTNVVSWLEICQTDFILWLRLALTNEGRWFPKTAPYWVYDAFPMFVKAESKQNLEKVLSLIGAKGLDGFTTEINKLQSKGALRHSDYGHRIHLDGLTNLTNLGKRL